MKLEMTCRNTQIADSLRRLPRKMLQLHGLDNITDFVLHELCDKHCFNIPKAAYFVDNPAFNCLKGVVGIAGMELEGVEDIWINPDQFREKIAQSSFNQNVRSFNYESRKKRGHSLEEMAETIAKQFDFKNYGFYSWDMKHDNHGFLVCEKNSEKDYEHPHDEMMVDGLSLLSFCPIY